MFLLLAANWDDSGNKKRRRRVLEEKREINLVVKRHLELEIKSLQDTRQIDYIIYNKLYS
jgi:hypothetical protein